MTHAKPANSLPAQPDVTADRSSLTSPSQDFVRDFTSHQRRLYLTILAQVHNPLDAEEILQNTNLVIWTKQDEFELGTNFYAWASRIATFEVLKHRQRHGREKLRFSDDFVRLVASEFENCADVLEDRRTALLSCLKKLTDKDRQLIEQRYQPGQSGDSLAAQLGRPVNSVYQSLGRIRRALHECVRRRLAAEAS